MINLSKIEYFLPKKVLTNLDLEEKFPDWSSEKIEKKVGISQRHIANDDETALDMAVKAAERLFVTYERKDIDFVLFCTQSPDYFLPTTACILQDRLNLRKNIGAVDFNLGCSGFIYGLAFAKSLIASKIANKVLLITSETYSKHLHEEDKANRSIFGDAAAATIVEKDLDRKDYSFILGTDGSGAENLIVKKGAFKHITDNNESNSFPPEYLYMNGPEIFNFTIEYIPQLITDVLKENNLTIEDIDYFIFHQANSFMLDYLRKKTKIPVDKFHIDIKNIGNTVSATIPIAIKDSLDSKKINKGDKVLLAGFGVGYSWGATIIEI